MLDCGKVGTNFLLCHLAILFAAALTKLPMMFSHSCMIFSGIQTFCWLLFSKLLPFPTTYLVEYIFSAALDILTKKKGTLEICEREDL